MQYKEKYFGKLGTRQETRNGGNWDGRKDFKYKKLYFVSIKV
jgi:hypothetical protein